MTKVVLFERMPLLFKGVCTFYSKGDEFDVVEVKELPQVGKCYRVSRKGIVFDGWQVAKFWGEIIE